MGSQGNAEGRLARGSRGLGRDRRGGSGGSGGGSLLGSPVSSGNASLANSNRNSGNFAASTRPTSITFSSPQHPLTTVKSQEEVEGTDSKHADPSTPEANSPSSFAGASSSAISYSGASILGTSVASNISTAASSIRPNSMSFSLLNSTPAAFPSEGKAGMGAVTVEKEDVGSKFELVSSSRSLDISLPSSCLKSATIDILTTLLFDQSNEDQLFRYMYFLSFRKFRTPESLLTEFAHRISFIDNRYKSAAFLIPSAPLTRNDSYALQEIKAAIVRRHSLTEKSTASPAKMISEGNDKSPVTARRVSRKELLDGSSTPSTPDTIVPDLPAKSPRRLSNMAPVPVPAGAGTGIDRRSSQNSSTSAADLSVDSAASASWLSSSVASDGSSIASTSSPQPSYLNSTNSSALFPLGSSPPNSSPPVPSSLSSQAELPFGLRRRSNSSSQIEKRSSLSDGNHLLSSSPSTPVSSSSPSNQNKTASRPSSPTSLEPEFRPRSSSISALSPGAPGAAAGQGPTSNFFKNLFKRPNLPNLPRHEVDMDKEELRAREHVMSLLVFWVENFSCDFTKNVGLKGQLEELLHSIQSAGFFVRLIPSLLEHLAEDQRIFDVRASPIAASAPALTNVKSSGDEKKSAQHAREKERGGHQPKQKVHPTVFRALWGMVATSQVPNRLTAEDLPALSGKLRSKLNKKMSAESPVKVAVTLTLIASEFFARIEYGELLNKNWSRKNAEALSPNLVRMIRLFNLTCFWVATEILGTPAEKDDMWSKVAMFKKWILIAEQLLRLRNYDSLFAVVNGLTIGPVERIAKYIISVLEDDYAKRLEQLKAVVSTNDNYKTYRALLKTIQQEQDERAAEPHPASAPSRSKGFCCFGGGLDDHNSHGFYLPFVGVLLKDLFALDDANANDSFQVGPNTLVNVVKWKIMANYIQSEVFRVQKTPFRPRLLHQTFQMKVCHQMHKAKGEKGLYDLVEQIAPTKQGTEVAASWATVRNLQISGFDF